MANVRLTADHVNYVVWRYLQESGFADAAVKLQRDWLMDPESLPFAETITSHMLVTLIQKGLQLYELEEIVKPGRTRAPFRTPPRPPRTIAPASSKTGAEGDANNNNDDDDDDDQDTELSAVDEQAVVGQPTQTPTTTDRPTPRRTVDASTGTAMEVIVDLTPHTSIIDSGEGEVMHIAWSPTEPGMLVTAGTESSPSIWNLAWSSSSSSSESSSERFTHGRADTLTRTHKPWIVSALAWHPSGEKVVIAACNDVDTADNMSSLWHESGRLILTFPAYTRPLMELCWSPSGMVLLGASVGYDHGEVIAWCPITGDIMSGDRIDGIIQSVHWLDESRFIVARSDVIDLYGFDGRMVILRRLILPHVGTISMTRLDPITSHFATVTSEGVLDIWDATGHLQAVDAHFEPVTALEWQPLTPSDVRRRSPHGVFDVDQPRQVATASVDGFVCIWNGHRPWQCLHRLSFGASHFPVIALAFAADGATLAAGSWGKVLVWDGDRDYDPTSSWFSQAIEPSGHVQGDGDDDRQPRLDHVEGSLLTTMTTQSSSPPIFFQDPSQHLLAWNSNATRLSYTIGRHVALIRYDRQQST